MFQSKGSASQTETDILLAIKTRFRHIRPESTSPEEKAFIDTLPNRPYLRMLGRMKTRHAPL